MMVSATRRDLAPLAATLNKDAKRSADQWKSTMTKHVSATVPAISGIDLSFRPRSYFGPVPLETHLLSRVAGQERRDILRRELAAGNFDLPPELFACLLDEDTRNAIGRIHPAFMGGEYLPPLRKGEVEIARISLESTTADQISVRARRVRERIRYRVVDEYELGYVCHPASSDAPLSLRQLVALLESASEGGSIIFPILAMNSRDSRSDELATFITVSSDFYADLGRYYRALTDAFLEELAREDAR